MRREAILSTVLALAFAFPTLASPPEIRAKVAVALALASLEEPPVLPVKSKPVSVKQSPTCPLGVPGCQCGCREGKPCRCVVVPTQPVYRPPVYAQPVYRSAPMPMMRSMPMQFGQACGPGG